MVAAYLWHFSLQFVQIMSISSFQQRSLIVLRLSLTLSLSLGLAAHIAISMAAEHLILYTFGIVTDFFFHNTYNKCMSV